MNSEFNEMERMFADGLHNYEVTPPAHIWGNIQKSKRKGLIYYNWKAASVLLLLLISGTVAYYFSSENNTKENLENTNTNSPAKTPELQGISGDENEINIKGNPESVSVGNNPSLSSEKNESEREKVRHQGTDKDVDNGNIMNKNVENTPNDFNNLRLNITSKDKIKFRYLIYPALKQYVFSSKKLYTKQYKTKTDSENDKKTGGKFSIEVSGGPSFAFRKLSGSGNMLRNESEKAGLSLQTSVKLNYHFSPVWSFQTGLTLENRNERINYSYNKIEPKLTQTSRQVIVYHPVLPPKTVTVIDSTYSDENIELDFISRNKYQTLNIPLVAGYSFTLGKLQYRVSAGPLFNIYSFNSGNTLAIDGNEIIMVPYNESAKVKTSLYTALALQYLLNAQYNLFTEVSYYKNISNRLNTDAVLNQKNFGYNLSGGLRINLIKQ